MAGWDTSKLKPPNEKKLFKKPNTLGKMQGTIKREPYTLPEEKPVVVEPHTGGGCPAGYTLEQFAGGKKCVNKKKTYSF